MFGVYGEYGGVRGCKGALASRGGEHRGGAVVVLRGDGAAPAQQCEGGQGVPRRGRHVQRVAALRVAAREAEPTLEQHEQHAWIT